MFSENYAKYYDRLNNKKHYQKEIEFVYKWAEKPNSVLDIGCGTASYWKFFPKKVVMMGIEKSEDMILNSNYGDRILWKDATKDLALAHMYGTYECVTALFDVINYMPYHNWWKDIPLYSGGHFIFDVLDKEKINLEKFQTTIRKTGSITRTIVPLYQDAHKVKLGIEVREGNQLIKEVHEMFLYDLDDILRFAGDDFDIADIHKTRNWQTWYKLKKK
jgi:SAM-dependent methyltransferase